MFVRIWPSGLLSHPGNGRVRTVRAPDNGRERKSLKNPLKISFPALRSLRAIKHLEMEARVGIEPTHKAFAEPCLTTWLPRRPVEEGKAGQGRGKPEVKSEKGEGGGRQFGS